MAAQTKSQATQAKKSSAKKTTPAAKKATPAAKKSTRAAQQTARSAEATAQQARRTAAQAERTVRSLVSDSAYAALGVGDSAVGALKHLPGEVERIRKEARLDAVRRNAGKEFAGYAARGRAVAQSVSRNAATTRALEQAKVARSQVRGAMTSVRKALGASVHAVDTATDKLGDEQRAG